VTADFMKGRLFSLSAAFSPVALETVEFRRVGLLHFITFTGTVTFHADGNILYATVEGILRYHGKFLSRQCKQQPDNYQDKDNESDGTLHGYIVSHPVFSCQNR
jgi:hypothetical protein